MICWLIVWQTKENLEIYFKTNYYSIILKEIVNKSLNNQNLQNNSSVIKVNHSDHLNKNKQLINFNNKIYQPKPKDKLMNTKNQKKLRKQLQFNMINF